MPMSFSDFDFDAFLNEHITEKQEKRKRIIGHFWATDLGKCHRQVYYSFISPKTFTPKSQRIFMAGSIIHDYLQKAAVGQHGKMFKDVILERRTEFTDKETGIVISGRMDIIVVPHEGEPFVVELKSINEKGFGMKKSASYSHRCQLNTYLHSEGLHHGLLVYINKTDLAVRAFRFGYDEKMHASVMRNLNMINSNLQQSKLPPKVVGEKWQCRYCSYQEECASNNNPALHNRLFPDRQVPVEQVVVDE